jgi:hypothetical protein
MITVTLAAGMMFPGGAAFAQYGPQGPPPDRYQNGPGGWDAPPQEFREAQQRGFRDGIDGARKDFDNHRRWDVNNRDEYRHPNVLRSLRRDYQSGFRRGYDVGVRHMTGGPGGPPPRY